MPAPAPLSTSTWWPRWTTSRTLPGTSPTRYSCAFTSLGTPISMAAPLRRDHRERRSVARRPSTNQSTRRGKIHVSLTPLEQARVDCAWEWRMMSLAILVMMYLAVGAALFAQPHPGSAEPADFTWRRQGKIFRETLPAVLAWPLSLWRLLRS